MRTISATVRTGEEAESARRRLQSLGIEGDRILFKELGEPGAQPGIFVTVKVAPEQVGAATDILNDAAAGARQPRAEPPPEPASDRAASAPRGEPAVERVERVERRTVEQHSDGQAAPTRDRQTSSPSAARIAAIGTLLAGLGFAAGAALGIVF